MPRSRPILNIRAQTYNLPPLTIVHLSFWLLGLIFACLEDPRCGVIPRVQYGYSLLCGSVVLFQCHTGFTLRGPPSVRCDPGSRQWTPAPPTCHGTQPHPSVSRSRVAKLSPTRDFTWFVVARDTYKPDIMQLCANKKRVYSLFNWTFLNHVLKNVSTAFGRSYFTKCEI